MTSPITSSIGKWRPVQGMFQAYAAYSGLRGLIAGPVPGQALYNTMGGHPDTLIYVFYTSLFIGGLAAMFGEIKQLIATRDNMLIKADNMIEGLYIESGGAFLISLNFFALMIAVFYSPTTVWERAIVYAVIGLGFLGRFCQAMLDIKRLKLAMREAGIIV